jgi:N-acyl-D-amino-acid deacylase
LRFQCAKKEGGWYWRKLTVSRQQNPVCSVNRFGKSSSGWLLSRANEVTIPDYNPEANEGFMRKLHLLTAVLFFTLLSNFSIRAQQSGEFDVLIRNGAVYDGTGGKARQADVAIRGDQIVAIGNFKNAKAKTVVDASGMVVAPGFINMLSHSYNSILTDGRSLGELRQGVTTQIFGEGSSMGPLSDEMKKRRNLTAWTTLAEYLSYAEKKGISQNVASYIGATTIREYVIGLEDKKATPEQLKQMRELVRQEMEAGALGIGSSLIYAPAFYATTEELIEMCKVASQYKGKYISHMRSEGNQLIEGVEELIRIAREAKIPAEIYHLKASGEANWPKMDQVIKMVEKARREGLKVSADMYTYTAGSTGLNSTLPPWTLDGGFEALFKRLQDPETRKKIAAEVLAKSDSWENMYQLAGSPERILLVGFRNPALRQYIGKTIGEVAKLRGKDPIETIMDLIVEDRSRVDTVYFMMSEENVKKQLKLQWVSFGSDAASMAAEGVFLNSSTHPRAYGNFARLLGKYVRDEKVISMQEAIRRLAALPAANLGLDRRGLLKSGYFADVVVFDPKTIADRATFEQPHQYAVGMRHVFVNGQQVLKDGEHTGAKSGRALWGPGKVK